MLLNKNPLKLKIPTSQIINFETHCFDWKNPIKDKIWIDYKCNNCGIFLIQEHDEEYIFGRSEDDNQTCNEIIMKGVLL